LPGFGFRCRLYEHHCLKHLSVVFQNPSMVFFNILDVTR
jgi:hypothetical protein